MRWHAWSVLAVTAAFAGCTTFDSDETLIIPDGTLNISKSWQWSFEGIAAGAALFFIIDPLAPNWQIQQSQIDADHYRIAMRKKRFTTGGDGEAAQIFFRRAAQLTREAGAASYRVIDYSEGVESNVPIAQRVANGVVEVVR